VVLYNAKKLYFHFCHPDPARGGPTGLGDGDGWAELPVPGLVAENMYHNGKLYVCDDQGHVTVFDAATLAVLGAVPPPLPQVAPPRRDAFDCTALVAGAIWRRVAVRDPALREGWAWGVTGGLRQFEGLPVGYGNWTGA